MIVIYEEVPGMRFITFVDTSTPVPTSVQKRILTAVVGASMETDCPERARSLAGRYRLPIVTVAPNTMLESLSVLAGDFG